MLRYFLRLQVARLLNFSEPTMTEVHGTSLDISALERRVKTAEKNIKLLQNEVRDIKLIIATFRKNGTTPFSSTLTSPETTSPTNETHDDYDSPNNKTKKLKLDLTQQNDYVVVYTDGSCENNGRANAKAGIGVWFGDDHPLNVSEPVKGKATNNNAEIQACQAALQVAKVNGIMKLKIVTDSQFVISSMTQWIKRWETNNWKTASGSDVKNKEEFVKLSADIKGLDDVQWEHVNGHVGVKGNEEADKLARSGALRYNKCSFN